MGGTGRERRKEPDYFGEALADFTHDMASGGAIRHMVNLGCSVDEIQRRLDFPTSRERVQRTVFDYMIKSKMLLRELPSGEASLRTVELGRGDSAGLCGRIRERIRENGEAQSCLACDYGKLLWGTDAYPGEGTAADRKRFRAVSGYRAEERRVRLEASLACLTGREREYLLGIPWEPGRMYHILNPRMAEIALQLAREGETEQVFCFLKTGERIVVKGEKGDCR